MMTPSSQCEKKGVASLSTEAFEQSDELMVKSKTKQSTEPAHNKCASAPYRLRIVLSNLDVTRVRTKKLKYENEQNDDKTNERRS